MRKNKLGLVLIMLLFSVTIMYAQANDPLVGQWEFMSGDWIYFFGESDINFRSNGTVTGEEGSGNWTVQAGRLRVNYDGDSENFNFSIRNNVLTITDSDGDSGRWVRSDTTSIQPNNPLIGQWEYVSGDWIYFFGESNINFRSNGTVAGEEGSGNWRALGDDIIRVNYDGDTESFYFSIRNNILTITDSDGDSGRWRRR